MTKVEYADSLPKARIFLRDGNVLVGESLGIEDVEDENEEITGELQIAFVPSFTSVGFYIKESEIDRVERVD